MSVQINQATLKKLSKCSRKLLPLYQRATRSCNLASRPREYAYGGMTPKELSTILKKVYDYHAKQSRAMPVGHPDSTLRLGLIVKKLKFSRGNKLLKGGGESYRIVCPLEAAL